jgi:hypothetical protein
MGVSKALHQAKRNASIAAKKKLSKVRQDATTCELCGGTAKLTKTKCSGAWTCDDERNAVTFLPS